jgi:hypothetical protein
MATLASIFYDFSLPNATTWFYFSFLLAVALFFRFGRFFSVRNWDVVTLFLLVPGLLLLQEARTNSAAAVASMVGDASQAMPLPGTGLEGVRAVTALANPALEPATPLRPGYLWLLLGSAYLLIRCLIDLTLERRPALSPNLNIGGLGWMSATLFIFLLAVAVRNPPESHTEPVGKTGAALDLGQREAVKLVEEAPHGGLAGVDTHFWVQRGLAMACHLLVMIGLVVIGYKHFGDGATGMAAATFYLLLPYTGMHIGQLHHVWPAALLIWAIALYRCPTFAGAFLGLAAGTAYFPVLVFPVWLSFYWRRGAGRFSVAFLLSAALCLAVTAITLWMDGELEQRVRSALALSDWQPWKVPTTESFWTGIHWVYRIPVFIGYLAFLVITAWWPNPKSLAHVLSLSAAALIGMQLWYADQGGVYILWYLPIVLLLVFRPNLADRRPNVIQAETDWLASVGRALGRLFTWLLRMPQPLARVR